MAYKQFVVNNRPLTIYKRKTSRSLRLTIGPGGELKLSIPRWASFRSGLDFVSAKDAWIEANVKPRSLLSHGQAIGKAHHLFFEAKANASRPTSRIRTSQIVVSYPLTDAAHDGAVQLVASRAARRALKRQAEQLLPPRLNMFAERYGFKYSDVTVKQLKRRWGSCDAQKQIVLNIYLMQLPWPLIDYVLLHELTHTEVFKHGPDFWQALERVLPNVKTLRRELKDLSPALS